MLLFVYSGMTLVLYTTSCLFKFLLLTVLIFPWNIIAEVFVFSCFNSDKIDILYFALASMGNYSKVL